MGKKHTITHWYDEICYERSSELVLLAH